MPEPIRRTFAVGDVQGCCDELRRLLEALRFDPARDRLWLTGDLVNRGPQSLETLRFVRSLGDAAVTVLGNHDLHLLAVAAGGRNRKRDTLDDVLAAPDRDELLDWLRHRPLVHHDAARNLLMLHAGLPPQWDVATAVKLAREAEAVIRGPGGARFFEDMYGNQPDRWKPGLRGADRTRFVINCLTRLRLCDADGRVALEYKGEPDGAPPGLVPWFAHPERKSQGTRIVFGHWSLLGQIEHAQDQVWCLDTGCVWGKCLTAWDVDTGKLVRQPCPDQESGGD